MLEPNAVLQDRYVISKPLAKGGMGAVYMAVDKRLKVNIALKETLFSDETLCKAFEREARLLANLRHNLLPKVIDHFTEGSKQYIVMEFIPGEDLSTLIKQQGRPFSVEDVLKWADQLLDLLDYMHNQEPAVIHRDIKPQNLKLTPRGEIVLLDFGLAKGQPSTINVTASIRAVATSLHGYTLNYSPPEQIEGTGTDPRSDLYALGATLYHLLTGAAPLDSVTRSLKILDSYPDPLIPASELNREVPKVLSNVLSKAMAIDKTARYQAATEMRDSLRKIYRADTANSQINSQDFQIRTPSSLHLQPTPKLSSTTFMAGHTGYIRSLAFSSDGQYVVSGSEDKTVRLWDANSFSELARYTGHGDWVTSVAFSPDCRYVASGSKDKTIRLWEIVTGRQVYSLTDRKNRVTCVAFSPKGESLLSGSGGVDKIVYLWDLASGVEQKHFTGHTDWISSVAFSPNGLLAISASGDKTARIWELSTGQHLMSLTGHNDWVTKAIFSPDGMLVATCSVDKTVRFWNWKTGSVVGELQGHAHWVWDISFSRDGHYLASSGRDGAVQVWDVKTSETKRTIIDRQGWIYAVALSPDSKRLVYGGESKVIQVFKLDE